MVSVLKLNVVLDEVDVIPAVYRLVVVRALDAYTLPVTFRVVAPVVPVSVVVFANTFVVVTAFAAYRLLVNERVERFETCQTFRVPTFAVTAKTFVVVKAFDT